MGIHFESVTYEYAGSSLKGETQIGLDDVTMTIPLGQFTAVLGASGSGKSTLLQHLNGMMKPTKGHVHILNTTISQTTPNRELHELRRQVGLVYQFPEQQCFEHTVEREISFGLRNYGMDEERIRSAVEQAASAVGLDHVLLTANPFQLSSGQLRKVALASVLAMEPNIIALDEPTASLDQTSRQELLQLLSSLVCDHGKTVIIVTHKLDEVFPFADNYVLIDNGKVLFHGDAHRLLEHAEQHEHSGGIKLPPAVKLWPLLARKFESEWPSEIRTVAQMVDYISSLLREG